MTNWLKLALGFALVTAVATTSCPSFADDDEGSEDIVCVDRNGDGDCDASYDE
jgi:hypothetical protein